MCNVGAEKYLLRMSHIVSNSNLLSSSTPVVTYDEHTQTTKVAFEKGLVKGTKAQLRMEFTGQLNDKMAGFYRSTYMVSTISLFKDQD